MLNRLLLALFFMVAGYAQTGDSKTQDVPTPPSGADRYEGLRILAEDQYSVWQAAQKKAYDALQKLKDPCNRPYILKLMAPLKKEAQTFFDKRLEWINAYTDDRVKALEGAKTFFAATDPLLAMYDTDRVNEEKLIDDNQEKLKNLPADEEKARQELQNTIKLQQDDLAKIKKNIEERQKIQKSGETARVQYEAQLEGLREHLKLVNADAQLVQTNYDALIAKYDVACSEIPIRDFRQDDPSNAKSTTTVKKKQ